MEGMIGVSFAFAARGSEQYQLGILNGRIAAREALEGTNTIAYAKLIEERDQLLKKMGVNNVTKI